MLNYWTNGVAQLYQGDARALPIVDRSVHCCVTSPPYWGLRDYGLADWEGGDPGCNHVKPMPDWVQTHLDKAGTRPFRKPEYFAHSEEPWPGGVCGHCGARQQAAGIGLEPTLSEWLENIVAVGREVWRVLRDDGTWWLNLGDAYAGGGGSGRNDTDRKYADGRAGNHSALQGISHAHHNRGNGLPAKSLMGQPWRAAFALQDDGWILRSAIVWHKPNPMPESVTDRPTNAYEMVFLLTKRGKYFYDAEAVRQPAEYGRRSEFRSEKYKQNHAFQGRNDVGTNTVGGADPSTGANLRNVWAIPTQGRPDAHFASFPDRLPELCILAGTSERGVCADCGAPWVRQVAQTAEYTTWKDKQLLNKQAGNWSENRGKGTNDSSTPPKNQTLGWQPTCGCGADTNCPVHGNPDKQFGHGPRHAGFNARWKANGDKRTETTGWQPTCACDAKIVPATVLDPFIGRGTTAIVAQRLGRRSIGVDLNPDYLALARKNLEAVTLPLI